MRKSPQQVNTERGGGGQKTFPGSVLFCHFISHLVPFSLEGQPLYTVYGALCVAARLLLRRKEGGLVLLYTSSLFPWLEFLASVSHFSPGGIPRYMSNASGGGGGGGGGEGGEQVTPPSLWYCSRRAGAKNRDFVSAETWKVQDP